MHSDAVDVGFRMTNNDIFDDLRNLRVQNSIHVKDKHCFSCLLLKIFQ